MGYIMAMPLGPPPPSPPKKENSSFHMQASQTGNVKCIIGSRAYGKPTVNDTSLGERGTIWDGWMDGCGGESHAAKLGGNLYKVDRLGRRSPARRLVLS